jgi:hypothetical protein
MEEKQSQLSRKAPALCKWWVLYAFENHIYCSAN